MTLGLIRAAEAETSLVRPGTSLVPGPETNPGREAETSPEPPAGPETSLVPEPGTNPAIRTASEISREMRTGPEIRIIPERPKATRRIRKEMQISFPMRAQAAKRTESPEIWLIWMRTRCL